MKLMCEFESLEEMIQFAEKLPGAKKERMEEGSQKIKKNETDNEEKHGEETPERLPESPQAAGQVPETESPACTLVDVRAKLSELQKSGKREQVKQLLEAFGAKKLSDVPEEKYGELMKKAGEL